MDRLRWPATAIILGLVSIYSIDSVIGDWDPNSRAPNVGGIKNTRHNMTMSYLGGGSNNMDSSRNDYGEVCVYCHTPHGANTTISAPLWNRTNKTNSYTTYDKPLTSGQTPTQPGVNSLVCLSCHDGTVAIDSIINMPGSGRYDPSQETGQNNQFLDDEWDNPSGNDPIKHAALTDCLFCHNTSNPFAPDFSIFLIGTDLTNDHPVGVALPDTNVYDFAEPNGVNSGMKFYDTNSDNRANTDEIRFYNTGEGYEVECGSCHDPHGVSPSGPGGALNPSFLRLENIESQLCLVCHTK